MSDGGKTVWEAATLLFLCLILALGTLGVVIWAMVRGLILTLDGLLLVAACLIFALAFGGNVAWSLHTGEAQMVLKELLRKPRETSNGNRPL
ncbi:MAG TPA: hypothetical protein VMO17_15115 [Terriglobia bacterium]|nr:hypothetical protein [Terriglobia bacterium]